MHTLQINGNVGDCQSVICLTKRGGASFKSNVEMPVGELWALALSAVTYANKNQCNYASEITGEDQ